MRPLVWLSAITTVLAATIDVSTRQTGACNNAASLCSKPYNQVVHLGAHNSAFRRDGSTDFSTSGNHYYNTTVQLSAGVRLLTAQVHKSNGGWHLCHSSCDLLDAGLLTTWLTEIKNWMDSNPNEVVTVILVNSDNASPADLHTEFTKSQVTSYAYKPESYSAAPASWPTLQSLITANTRLVTFIASIDVAAISAETSYLMNEFTFVFENKFENTQPSDFSCQPNRPSSLTIESALASNRMPLMNHFLYTALGGIVEIQVPDVDNITVTNSPDTQQIGALGYSADTCTSAYGSRAPNFVLVDFFDQGPALDTIDRLNGVSGQTTGRTAVPKRDEKGSETRAAAGWARVQQVVQQFLNGEDVKKGAWIWAAGKWSWGGMNVNGGGILE